MKPEKGRSARHEDMPLEDRLASTRRRCDFNAWLDRQPRDADGNVIEGRLIP
jgi:hypothetical protein